MDTLALVPVSLDQAREKLRAKGYHLSIHRPKQWGEDSLDAPWIRRYDVCYHFTHMQSRARAFYGICDLIRWVEQAPNAEVLLSGIKS